MMPTTVPAAKPPRSVAPRTNAIMSTGRMAEAVKAYDWAATPLGAIDRWPPVLAAHVNLALSFPNPAVVHWGPDLHMIFNDAYAGLLGPEGELFLGQRASFVWKPIWHIIGPNFENVLRKGESLSGDNLLIPVEQNGVFHDFYWSYALAPIYHRQAVAGIFNTARNTTDSVDALNALVRSDERLRLALSATDCTGIWDWNLETDLVHGEEDFALSFGGDPSRARTGVPRSDYMEKIHADDAVRVYEALHTAVRSASTLSTEYRIPQADGTVRWIWATGRCLYGEDGAPTRFHGINVDISRRKFSEEALAEAQMQSASARFRATLNTRIEAPLASIATILRLARSTDDLSEVQRFLAVAERELNRVAELAQQTAETAPASGQCLPHALIIPPAEPSLVWSMELLVCTIARSLAEHKDEVRVKVLRTPQEVTLLLQVAPGDLGRVLGRQGRTAQSIRTLLNTIGMRSNRRFILDVEAVGAAHEEAPPTGFSSAERRPGARDASQSRRV